MKAVLVSHRFNPGHVSHILANMALLRESGFEVHLRCSWEFYPFADCDRASTHVSIKDCLGLGKGDLFVVWFSSVKALLDVTVVRLFTRATVVFIYHEPYVSFRSYRQGGFGIAKSVRVFLVSIISRLICRLSAKVVLPSRTAAAALKGSGEDRGRFRTIPLLFDDERGTADSRDRNAISYIGTVAEDHAFEEFVGFVQRAIENGDLQGLRFVIATRSDIPDDVRDVVVRCQESGRLAVQSGRPMSNKEINRFYAESLVVWNAYKRSMQSGVLPKAYMFGTPALISSNNKSEFFADGKTGKMISGDYHYEEVVRAVELIAGNWRVLSANCREFFLKVFHYRSSAQEFMGFVQERDENG